jgi:branched-chain amino acid aminotransferase
MSVNWFNGTFVDDTLALDVGDRGFLLGDGVFETIAVNHGHAVWLDEHLQRMADAAVELGIAYDAQKIRDGVDLVLQKSAAKFEILRITLSRGATVRGFAADGVSPNLLISRNLFDVGKQPQSLRLSVSKIRRNETAPSSRLKTLSYIDDIAAAREVASIADDALMLNTAGHVASTTVGNIFLLRGSELITPQLDQGILAGITRAKILEFSDWKTKEAMVSLNDILTADAVFVTNSLRLATPVSTLDGETLGKLSVQDIKNRLETLTGRI